MLFRSGRVTGYVMEMEKAAMALVDALGQLGFRKVNIATAPEAQK